MPMAGAGVAAIPNERPVRTPFVEGRRRFLVRIRYTAPAPTQRIATGAINHSALDPERRAPDADFLRIGNSWFAMSLGRITPEEYS